MSKFKTPQEALRYHVSGAIARGEKEAITEIRPQLEALAAMPRKWSVTTHFADGATRVYRAHSEAGAENYATGERRKIGHDLISRETGAAVRVVDVTVSRIN